jgi:alkanesulfonate monooxygenase SsuD/methylene tetrahydromethanopterin reductase-like flavin-dependent oxidoreductase (luciferase family)
MKIGIAGANIAIFADRDHATALARTAEAAGVESLWTYEHIAVPAEYRSAYPYSSSGRMPDEGTDFPDALDWIAFLGVPWEHRGPRADEYIQVMRRLWSADEATFTGRFVQFQRVRCFQARSRSRAFLSLSAVTPRQRLHEPGESATGFTLRPRLTG